MYVGGREERQERLRVDVERKREGFVVAASVCNMADTEVTEPVVATPAATESVTADAAVVSVLTNNRVSGRRWGCGGVNRKRGSSGGFDWEEGFCGADWLGNMYFTLFV